MKTKHWWHPIAVAIAVLIPVAAARAEFPIVQIFTGGGHPESLAISGAQVLAGDPSYSFTDYDGAAFVFEIGSARPPRRIAATPPVSDQQFGTGVAIGEDYAIATDSDGGVWVFDARTWEPLFRGDTYLGTEVAIHGGTALVATEYEAVLVDVRTDSIIRALDLVVPGEEQVYIDEVELEGDYAVVTASDAVYVFDVGSGEQLHRLTVPGGADQRFGAGLAIADGMLVVGAPGKERFVPDGAAYVYDLASGQLLRQHAWVGPAGEGVRFGDTVAIGKNFYMVAAPYGQIAEGKYGGVQLYHRETGEAGELILNPGSGDRDGFGQSMVAQGDLLLVGASRLYPDEEEPHDSVPGIFVYDLSPEPQPQVEEVFAAGSEWKWWDENSRPAGWNLSRGEFDDAAWQLGIGQFGYGDGDEDTVIRDGQFERVTSYFRKTFWVTEAQAAAVERLELHLLCDDGAVVYLNGEEIARLRMPEGEVGHETTAVRNAEGDGEPPAVIEAPGTFQPGENVIAVEVHNAHIASGDISFDLALRADFLPVQPYPGAGTLARPFLISTAGQLAAIADHPQHWDSDFRLVADIDLGEHGSFRPIGISGNGPGEGFGGSFDGQRHTISNLQLDEAFLGDGQRRNLGLFSFLHGGAIKDLILVNPVVDAPGTDSTGTIVGRAEQSWISRCRVIGARVLGAETCGGIVGSEADGYFESNHAIDVVVVAEHGAGGCAGGATGRVYRCSSSGSVSGGDGTGGLIGGAFVGSNRGPFGPYAVRECFSTCDVSGEDRLGGLIGWNTKKVRDCYARGPVTGNSKVGGLVGSKAPGYVFGCYSTGEARSAGGILNGLIGDSEGSSNGVLASFWDADTSGQSESEEGGIGKTTAEMLTVATYTTTGNWVDRYWLLRDGSYPRLQWEDLSREGDADGDGLLDAWEVEHFWQIEGVDPDDDPDGDRLDNQLERALGLDPMSPLEDEELLPGISIGAISGEAGARCLNFTFSLPEEIPEDVVYEVQVSGALGGAWQALATRALDGSWSGDGAVSEHVASDGRVGVTVCDSAALAAGGKRFMRLVVR